MSFAGSVVELCGDGIAGALGQSGHALALGEVLADQAVGVLVRSAFPAVVRGGEVVFHATARFHPRVTVELGPIVRRDGAEAAAVTSHQFQGGAVGFGGGARAQFPDQDVAGLAFD